MTLPDGFDPRLYLPELNRTPALSLLDAGTGTDDDELSIDFETYSEIDLPKQGAHKYAQHESTFPICMAWALNDEEVDLWLPWQPLPDRVEYHIRKRRKIRAWNAAFERLIARHVMVPKFDWPEVDDEQWDCTMTRALAMNMPAKLELAAPAFRLDIRKDDVGHRIMKQVCKPRKPTKKDPSIRFWPALWAEKFQRVYAYCKDDVRTERAVGKRTIPLRRDEQRRYWRDLKVNDRGVAIDMELVESAQSIVDSEKARLDAEIKDITNGAVNTTGSVSQIKAYIARRGIPLPKLDKDGVNRALARAEFSDPLSDKDDVRRVLEIRQEAAKTSTAKLNAFRLRLCDDETVKGTIQFCGAGQTGRDAARGLQTQNFPRPDPEMRRDIIECMKDVRTGDVDWVRVMQGAPMGAVADSLRGMIVARKGRKLRSMDLSQIEARVNAWLAGQDNVLEAYVRYDAGDGPDLYIVTAAGIYNVPVDTINKDDPRRQVGKVSLLALGFGGGAGAFGSMAKIYKVDVAEAYGPVMDSATAENIEKAREGWKARGRASGMSKKAWLTAELIKLAWREANPMIVQNWYDLKQASLDAVDNPGQTFTAGKMRYRMSGSFLKAILPSGRPIYYPYPRIEQVKTPWGKLIPLVTFEALDGYTHKWQRHKLNHLLLDENAVQATARDVMMEAWDRTEDAGYECVMRVHDELIDEDDEDFGSDEEFKSLFLQPPKWAKGLPIAGAGWIGDHYRKG